MHPTSPTTPALDLSRLQNVKRHGDKIVAACPACREAGRDKTGNHLSIDAAGRYTCALHPGPDGHAHRQRIFELVGRNEQPRPIPRGDDSKLATRSPAAPDAATLFNALANSKGRQTGRWAYRNAAGEIIFEVGRFDPPVGKKTYCPILPDADGWRPGLPAGPLPLFNLPALLASDPTARVYVTEGEKCADAVNALGLLAVCSQGGSGAANKTDWTPLAGRCVTILPDNDEPGRKYVATVKNILERL